MYGEEARDLSSEGYASAMSRLRKENPALAQRVSRILRPMREQAFPRSQVPWQDTSVGRQFRVALLPDNPHFREDVALLRSVLGLPEGQIACEEDNPVRLGLASSALLEGEEEGQIRSIALRVLARSWISLHHGAFNGSSRLGAGEGLTPEVLAAAQQKELNFPGQEVPHWLKTEPSPHPNCHWDARLPLHLASALVLERHRLPNHLCPWVMIYTLTHSSQDLRDLESERVSVFQKTQELSIDALAPPDNSWSVLVLGIDEYTTKDDWERMWNRGVEPLLQQFSEGRGLHPQRHRSPSFERLKEGMPLYEAYLESGSLENALIRFQEAGLPEGEMENETARRVIRDLQSLLDPNTFQ